MYNNHWILQVVEARAQLCFRGASRYDRLLVWFPRDKKVSYVSQLAQSNNWRHEFEVVGW